MYRTLTLAMRFADWLSALASAASTKASTAAEVAEEKAVEHRRNVAATKLLAAAMAKDRADRILREQRKAYAAEQAAIEAAHPGF